MRNGVFLLVWLSVWPVAGAATGADRKPPTAEASAEASALIAAAGAGDYFAEDSEGEVPAARHLRSGLRCSFEPHSKFNKILVYPQSGQPPIPAGDDVSCETSSVDFNVSIYATRYPFATTVDEQLGVAVSAIRQRFAKVRPYSGTAVEASTGGPPEHKTARFEAELDGMKYFTRASVAMVGGWTVLQRVSGPLSKADQGDVLAEIDMVATLLQLTEAPKPST
jgi:hypothetical protein